MKYINGQEYIASEKSLDSGKRFELDEEKTKIVTVVYRENIGFCRLNSFKKIKNNELTILEEK